MKRLLELVIILLCVMVLSAFAGSIKEPFTDIVKTSEDIAMSGFSYISSFPSTRSRSFIRFVPTLDDLLKTDYLKKDFSQGLAGLGNISSRTCGDNSNGLTTNMNSNKKDCGVMIDLQPYDFRAGTAELTIIADKTNSSNLAVVPNEEFIKFLLKRPVFITIGNSRPYVVDFTRVDHFLFTTDNIRHVERYKNFPASQVIIPITEMMFNNINNVADPSKNLFPNAIKPLPDILREKVQNVAAIKGVTDNYVKTTVNIYYTQRKKHFGNSLKIPNNDTVACVSDNAYMQSIVEKFRIPMEPLKPEHVTNPTLSIKFSLFVNKTGGSQHPWWMSQWIPLLSVGANDWSNCNHRGRGILLVETRPLSYRQSSSWGIPYREGDPANPEYICLDFTNVEKDNNNNIEWCGAYNRGLLWLPTGVNVDIACIVSASMKIIVACYYDPASKKRHITFLQTYHRSGRINDILGTIKSVDKVCINNLCKRANRDPNQFRVSNVELSYGMLDLVDWLQSSN